MADFSRSESAEDSAASPSIKVEDEDGLSLDIPMHSTSSLPHYRDDGGNSNAGAAATAAGDKNVEKKAHKHKGLLSKIKSTLKRGGKSAKGADEGTLPLPEGADAELFPRAASVSLPVPASSRFPRAVSLGPASSLGAPALSSSSSNLSLTPSTSTTSIHMVGRSQVEVVSSSTAASSSTPPSASSHSSSCAATVVKCIEAAFTSATTTTTSTTSTSTATGASPSSATTDTSHFHSHHPSSSATDHASSSLHAVSSASQLSLTDDPSSSSSPSLHSTTAVVRAGKSFFRRAASHSVHSTSSLKGPGSSNSQDEKHMLHGVRVLLKHASGVLACDSTGFSDPYCIFKIGKHAKHRSSTKRQTLKPNWSEEFFLPCPADCTDPLVMDMYDWDGFSRDDYMGSCLVSLDGLTASPQELTLKLMNRSKKQMQEDLGTVTFVLSRSVEHSKKGTLLQRLLSAPVRNRLVVVDVVAARGLPATEGDATMDSYVKLKIGKSKQKSKVVEDCASPAFGQRFEFAVQDNSQTLSIQLCRAYVNLDRQKILAFTDIDLSDFPFDAPVDKWYPLETADHHQAAVELHLQVTVSDLFCETPTAAVTPTSGQALLTVEVMSARNIRGKDSGRVDPYVVVELGNTRLRTMAVPKSSEPRWDRVFQSVVEDVYDNLQVTVYDEHRRDFVGRVLIPLQKIKSGAVDWYVLKDEMLFKRAVGEIQLRLDLNFTLPTAALQLIARHKNKYISPEDRLRFPLLKLHFARVKSAALFLATAAATIDGLFCWRYGFAKSAAAMMFWVLLCLFFDWHMAPLLPLALLVYTLLVTPYMRHKMNFDEKQHEIFSDTPPDLDDEDDEDDDDIAVEENSRKGLMAMWGEFTRIAIMVQSRLDDIASFCERVKNLVMWTTPLITSFVCAALVVAALVLYMVPLNWLLLAWGVKKFTKKGLQKYGFLPAKGPSVNELLELIERVPSDLDLVRCRPFLPARASVKSSS